MLKEIRFKNWKSFEDATLYIDPLTVLIGTNASGKSNVLDGLDFLSKVIRGTDLETVFSEIRGGSEWAARKPFDKFTIEAVAQSSANADFLYGVEVSTSPKPVLVKYYLNRISYNEDGSVSQDVLLDADLREFVASDPPVIKLFSIMDLKTVLVSFVSAARRHEGDGEFGIPDLHDKLNGIDCITEALEGIFILDPIPSKMRDYVSFSTSLNRDASNLAGVLAALPPSEKETVEQTLSHYVSQLPEQEVRKVWAEPVGRLKKDAMLYCEEGWVDGQEPTLIDASGMSDGTLRFLGILTALLTRPQGSQIIIEEVDNGLHPSRAGLLLKMLREIGSKRKIDVLVTTHNPALLDALGPEMVPFVVVAHRSPTTGESKLTLLEDINNLPKLFASGPLGKLVTQGDIEKTLSEGTEPTA